MDEFTLKFIKKYAYNQNYNNAIMHENVRYNRRSNVNDYINPLIFGGLGIGLGSLWYNNFSPMAKLKKSVTNNAFGIGLSAYQNFRNARWTPSSLDKIRWGIQDTLKPFLR